MTTARGLIVALDGPGSSGKSSVGAAAAREVGYRFCDTGLLYRAVTWLAEARGVPVDDPASLVALVAEVELAPDATGRLSRVVVDFSGRPGLHMRVDFKSGMIGALDTQLVYEFFQGFSNHAGVTLHIDNLEGDNAHHQCETIFKAFARALRMALEIDPRAAGVIPSTKGSL